MSSALVFGLLTGCGIGANTDGSSEGRNGEEPKQNEVASKFHTSIATKEENNSVIVQYKVKNISGKPQQLTFPSGLKVDYILYDESGNKVKQYSEEVFSTQAIVEMTLENDQELAQEFTLTDLTNGNYKVEVFLTAKEEQAKVMTDILIEKSLLTQASGVLVGQMDPHSVEIMIDGIPTAFQLTEVAQQQLSALKDGDQVTFIYTESEIEQKTIEKFLMESN